MTGDTADQGGRYALIVATGQYADGALRKLRSPATDAEELTDVIEDPSVGGYAVRQLVDQPDNVARVEIEGFFADARPDDFLLLYLSCHGVKDQNGQLYFAATNTRPSRLASTGISAEFVHQQVSRCRSRKIVLLLDCCYSGSYARGHRPRALDDASLGSLDNRGWAVMTSSTALEYSFEIDSSKVSWARVSRKVAPSLFTAAIVEGLRTGAADLNQDGLITFDELYDYVWASVRARTPHQTPVKKWGDVQGSIILARSPHPRAPKPTAEGETGDGALIRVSRRQAMAGLAAITAAAGISCVGWELAHGGSGAEIWQTTIGGDLIASSLVTDGFVYTDDGTAVCKLHAADGRLIWKRPISSGEPGGQVVLGDVIVGYRNLASVYAVRASDGTMLWSFPLSVQALPAVAGGIVCTGDLEGYVYGLRAHGQHRVSWQIHIGGQIDASPVAAGTTVYVSNADGKLWALDVRDGSVSWRSGAGNASLTVLTVAAGVIYALSGDGHLYAISASSGRRLWRFLTGGIPAPAIVDGTVYVGLADHVCALRERDGHKFWEAATDTETPPQPVAAGGIVCTIGNYDDVYAFRAEHGTKAWHFNTRGYVASPPVAAAGSIYFGSSDHNVYAVRGSSGRQMWSFATYGEITAPPTVVNGVVYAGSGDGNIYAVRA
jgi:outer membrane protein assembly factor BamB